MPETNDPAVDQRVMIERVGDIEVEPRADGYAVTIRLNAAPPDADWLKLFEHPPGLPIDAPARRATIAETSIEILVRNEEQMNASVRYAEKAVSVANQAYNDEVLPRRARHRRIREELRGREQVDLDSMARAANAL